MCLSYRVFILDLYKRWASPRKKLTRLGHETSYLDYSIPSFKVPGVFGALAPWEVCFWHQNYQKELFAGAETTVSGWRICVGFISCLLVGRCSLIGITIREPGDLLTVPL
jgi:hypothetical protein